MTAAALLRMPLTAQPVQVAPAFVPKLVREVHQIELTTRCNLKCKYCPHWPELPRPKTDMTLEVFQQALALVRHYVARGTQGEVSLTGIGEPTLHPNFVEMLAQAREAIGPERRLAVATNGLLLDDALCDAIKPYDPVVFVSLHRPELGGPAIERLKARGFKYGVNSSFATSAFNWAGTQRNWFVSAQRVPCDYLKQGWCVVLVDGRVATCCLDATGASVVGHVLNNPAALYLQPWRSACGAGCASCHMDVPA